MTTRGILLAFLLLVAAASWTSDDASITFRVVEQLVHGHGPRWNPDDRVLVSTHPAWLLLLGALRACFDAPTRLVARVAELTLTAVAAGLLVRGRPPSTALVLAAALLGSKTLVEFATSGLEGALLSALLVGLGVALRADRPAAVGVLAGLVVLTRHDAVLLVGPLLLLRAWQTRRAVWALAPLLVVLPWLAFATVWYGSPLPQPFVAKLQDGLPLDARWARGLAWLDVSLRGDPTAALALGLGVPLALWRGDRDARALACGALLGLLYAVQVGGDFMAGRFLHAPLWALLVALARVDLGTLGWRHVGASAALAAGLVATPHAPLRTLWTPASGDEAPTDVSDERAFYAEHSTLRDVWAEPDLFDADRPATPPVERTLAGLGGLEHGLHTHVVEPHGLTDAFRARLPAFCDDARAGHCWRPLPPGYLETLATGTSHLVDPDVTACWERVARVHRGPVFAPGRASAAWALFARGCDDLWRGRHLDRDGRLVRP